ncbi:GntR family transcriptional regulator [Streptomyces rapamycinicus]|uniref:DNA-binding GntR family transcriptional regulator n=1 Tax=Streptomyces rapamycinicus TaxID=1226757 RepID=A0ABR6L9Y1_9ACTN|nr:GntR family transcriptional regulator [Streptomyces rapamycinicus]MBB4779140.1 DNA-binding GntR family transcriptional regulator [Streptomyces rapamycinicus]UTP27955.1 GntR family transcriptional regulator [Streptomyces rapamycinicus NRRL 5491]
MVEQVAGAESAGRLRPTRAGAVAEVVDRLHEMLFSMELLPGQSLRQEALAARLGVSRAPVREALRILESEGILEHVRNVGYSVKRLTAAEFEQTYLMRRALETEVIRALPPFPEDLIKRLREVNREIREAGERADFPTLHRLNVEFHFLVFQASGLDLVVDELQRVWTLSNVYRSAYLAYDHAARQRIVHEHDAMIEALRRHDTKLMTKLMDEHRAGTRAQIGSLLAGTAP